MNILSEEYKSNYQYIKKLNKNLQTILNSIQNKRNIEYIKKHKKKGKLLVRERIKLLVDAKTRFLEFSPLAAYEQYDNQFPGAGIITGIGLINDGQPCSGESSHPW